MKYEELFKIVIKDIDINKKSDKLFGLGFIGIPGIGKSFLSKKLEKELNIQIVSRDKIRRLLESFNIDPKVNRDLVYKLAYDEIEYLLNNNISLIVDSNLIMDYKDVLNIFQKFGVNIYFLKLICNDKTIIDRLDKREKSEEENYSRATKDTFDYYKKREENNPFPKELIYYEINTELDLENQIDELISKLNNDNIL